MKKRIDVKRYVTYTFPRVVILVTTIKNHKPNVFAVAWHYVKPVYYVGKDTYTTISNERSEFKSGNR